MRRVLLGAALVAPLLVPLAPGRAASPCAVDLEQRNAWHRVAAAGVVAMADKNPCSMLRVKDGGAEVSDDGGLSWRRVGDAPAAAAELVTAGLPTGTALLVGSTGGVWLTTDRGRSWTAAAGLPDRVRQVVTDGTDANRVFAIAYSTAPPLQVALPVAANATVLESDNGGRSFAALQGATGLNATSFAVDEGVPSRFWLGLGGKAGGLFVSSDAGTTFTRAAGGDVRAIVTGRLAGGGSEVLAATDNGVVLSRDGGATTSTRLSGTAVDDLQLEWDHPSAAMLVAGGVLRSSDSIAHSRPQGAGLPADCRPRALRRDHSVPSVFLLSCADGSTWRFRGDGTDLSSTDNPDNGVPNPLGGNPVGPAPEEMAKLGTRKLPTPGSRQDGSIAFDGVALYYTDQQARGLIHRMVALTGRQLPDLRVDGPTGLVYIAYDANVDRLYVADTEQRVWQVSLPGGVGTELFRSPLGNTTGTMSFDSATEHFLFADDHGDGVYEYDLAGRLQSSCPSLGLTNLAYLAGNAEGPDIAAVVATGDGLLYVESEDDTTVVRADRACHVLAGFQHETFSEASAENDAIACDTTTFPGRTAIWLRDASAGTAVAYSVDSGYCALPSRISVTAPSAVATGGSGRVCAQLRSRAKGTPLPGLPVDLLVAGRGIGSPVTDRLGRACTDYVPLPSEAGAGSGTSHARQPVLAAFLGTSAYRPSDARASLLVSRSVVPPGPPPPVEAPPAAPVVLAAPVPPPPVQPPQPPPPAPQQAPVAQGHPGAQPGAMGQPGAAMMPEDEAEAAAQGADTHLMTGVDWEAYALPSAFGVLAFAAVLRRRRASRVRSQSA